MFFGIHVVYLKPLTVQATVTNSLALVGMIFVCLTFVFMVNHISSLHNLLDFANSENIRLLHGMHEGVLIIKKPEQHDGVPGIMFSNKPAEKLL